MLNLDLDRISALGAAAFMTALLTALHYCAFPGTDHDRGWVARR